MRGCGELAPRGERGPVADPLPRGGGQQDGQAVQPPTVPRAEADEPLPGVLLVVEPDARAPEILHDGVELVAPDHGIAFGLDRVVALIAGKDNIREVIAFPKTQSGLDPLTGAPSEVSEVQLRELGLRLLPGTPPA